VHNNYYFLRQLSSQLKSLLDGFSIVSCFSQNKEELVMEFNNKTNSFFIKASLQSQFSCLSFPDRFTRARKNSIDLFADIILKKVIDVRQFENERSFSIQLEDDYQLLFKMHGNRANVVLIKKDVVEAVFRNHLKADFEIDTVQLDRSIDWSKEAFLANHQKLNEHYFTFGKEVWRYLNEQGFETSDKEHQWRMIQQTLDVLNKPVGFYILEHENKLTFSLLPYETIVKKFDNPMEAINDFFYRYTIGNSFRDEKTILLKQLNDQLSASLSYVFKNKQKLTEIENDHRYKAWGDLLMANLHIIKSGDEKVIVDNFYDNNHPVEIKLKKDISPQKNAEVFYRKGKNQQIEIRKLKEAITKKEKEIERIKKNIADTEVIDELKTLRKQTEVAGIKSIKQKTEELLPFHEFEFRGYKIWVGRNAESNDQLTLKYSYKEDLWLHAKDVPGSHVIIKHQSGKNFPKEVIERAAELAAYNSKRKTDTLCPVIVTPKKFVRKRKGDPAGAVVVEREDVIMVEPKLEAGS
jgi:predicted ribosome quality control (RQC) complex YloA/Tae2 family protein